MIVDSNVIIRLLHMGVPAQTRVAQDFLKKVEVGQEKAEISILVIDEVIYVLNTYYKIERANFIPELIKILSIRGVDVIEANKEVVMEILAKMVRDKIDFTDYYLASLSSKDQIFTFDKDFKRLK